MKPASRQQNNLKKDPTREKHKTNKTKENRKGYKKDSSGSKTKRTAPKKGWGMESNMSHTRVGIHRAIPSHS